MPHACQPQILVTFLSVTLFPVLTTIIVPCYSCVEALRLGHIHHRTVHFQQSFRQYETYRYPKPSKFLNICTCSYCNVILFGGNMDLPKFHVHPICVLWAETRPAWRYNIKTCFFNRKIWLFMPLVWASNVARSLSCRVQVCLRPPQAVEAARLALRVRHLQSRSSLMMDWMMSWWEMRRIGWSWPRWQRQRENRRCTIGVCVCVWGGGGCACMRVWCACVHVCMHVCACACACVCVSWQHQL